MIWNLYGWLLFHDDEQVLATTNLVIVVRLVKCEDTLWLMKSSSREFPIIAPVGFVTLQRPRKRNMSSTYYKKSALLDYKTLHYRDSCYKNVQWSVNKSWIYCTECDDFDLIYYNMTIIR